MKNRQRLRNNKWKWQKYFLREKIIKLIREFFYKQKFHELETPLLVPAVIPESYLDVFKTSLINRQGKKRKMFLTTSPEASLKKLLVAGIGNCFEITKSFRNSETGSNFHHPEFTILEWYRIDADYRDIMNDCEKLTLYICAKIKNQSIRQAPFDSTQGRQDKKSKIKNKVNKINNFEIDYQGKKIDLSRPWERISMKEAFDKFTGICFDEITEFKNGEAIFPIEKIAKIALKKGYQVKRNSTWEELFNQIFLNEIEPFLGKTKPTIIYDYPKPLAALSEIKKDDPRLAERFELYIGGLELGDCYTELTNYKEQKKRFTEELQLIKKLGKTQVYPDKDFLEAIKIGLPKCSGIAVGVDRLVMLFTDSKSIDETLLFPLNEYFKV